MRLKTVLPVLVILAAILGAIALLATRETVVPKPTERRLPALRFMTVEPQSLTLTVRSQGTVAPRTESQLIAEVPGPVVWTSPALVAGGYFGKGEPLVRIDPARYETALARAEAALGRARGEHEYARSVLARQERLAADEIVSATLFEDTQRAMSVAEAALRDAEAALVEAERDLARTEIKAPFRGRVREESVDVGQYVTVGSPFATLYATDYLEVRLPIPDEELAYFETPLWASQTSGGPGPEVRLHTRFAGAPRSWWGEVVRTEGEIDPKSRMVHVIARVENPERGRSAGQDDAIPITVGLFVQAEIAAGVAEDVFVLPRAALRGGDSVVTLDSQSRLEVRPVSVLRLERDHVVVSAGLEAGERVALAPPAELIEGQQVNALDAEESMVPSLDDSPEVGS